MTRRTFDRLIGGGLLGCSPFFNGTIAPPLSGGFITISLLAASDFGDSSSDFVSLFIFPFVTAIFLQNILLYGGYILVLTIVALSAMRPITRRL